MRPTRTSLLVLAFAIAGAVNAQFDALPDSNATWTESFWIGPGYPYTGYYYTYDAGSPDTVYNGDVYKKLLVTFSSGGSVFGTSYGGALHDNSMGQVFYWEPGAPDPVLLYDFDVVVGDTLYGVAGLFPTDVRVYDVDTVVVNGTQRKRIAVECLDGPAFYDEYWTQGIGSNHGLLHATPCGSVSGIGTLVCMTVNDTVQWGVNVGATGDCSLLLGQADAEAGEDRLAIHPNPATDQLTVVHHGSEPLAVEVIAADGRSVLVTPLMGATLPIAALPPGAYVLKAREASGKVLVARFVKR